MLTRFTTPDKDISGASLGVLLACDYLPDTRIVVDVNEIASVVAMVPLPLTAQEKQHPQAQLIASHRFFVVEKPGLDMSICRGDWDDDDQEEDPDDD